jgi:hypothetical protein
MEQDIMKYQSVLPKDFDGTFRFTNWTEHDFIGKWGSKEYRFPARTTSPILILDQTPLEIQQIRKKFAKDLAEQEFFRSQQYAKLMNQERNTDGSVRLNSIHQAGTYSMDDLKPFIQKCLEPLPAAVAFVTEVEKTPLEEVLSKNDAGEINTTAIDSKTSLKKKALES